MKKKGVKLTVAVVLCKKRRLGGALKLLQFSDQEWEGSQRFCFMEEELEAVAATT